MSEEISKRSEENRTIFTPVTAVVKKDDGTQIDALGYRLDSGQYDLTQKFPFGLKKYEYETYIRSRDYILQISADGLITRLCIDPHSEDYRKKDEVGYLITGVVKKGDALSVTTGQYFGGVGVTPESVELTEFPVEEMILQTFEPIAGGMATTTTPIDFREN